MAATAGIVSPFSITIKDSFNNWQPDPSVSQSGVQIAMSDINGRSTYVSQVTSLLLEQTSLISTLDFANSI
jgi:hypothetical protein